MKTTIAFLAAAMLLCGCQKPAAPTPAPAVPKTTEYNVVIYELPLNALAEENLKLAKVEEEYAEAKNQQKFAIGKAFGGINATELAESNLQAGADYELKKVRSEVDVVDEEKASLQQAISEQSTNGWELVSACTDPNSAKQIILIFKRLK